MKCRVLISYLLRVTGQECLTSTVGRGGIKHLTPCEGTKNSSPCAFGARERIFYTFTWGEVFYTSPSNCWGKVHTYIQTYHLAIFIQNEYWPRFSMRIHTHVAPFCLYLIISRYFKFVKRRSLSPSANVLNGPWISLWTR